LWDKWQITRTTDANGNIVSKTEITLGAVFFRHWVKSPFVPRVAFANTLDAQNKPFKKNFET
jgi:hypothetical protein